MARIAAPLFADAEMNRAMLASVGAIAECLAASRSAAQCVVERLPGFAVDDGAGGFDLSDDAADLLIGEAVSLAAPGAGKLQPLQFQPSDWYLELCAAIAGDGDADVIRIDRGWPILSVAVGTPTVTEARGGRNAPAAEAAR